MTGALTVSVVIVSRYRPDLLRRCLIGLSQVNYDPFEVVVVADPASCSGLRSLPQAAHAKIISFDEANISAARNIGIKAAAGEIIAFIDDDSVPEPTWLMFLVAPFRQTDVAACGGFVRGRNGISFQHRARWVDRAGRTGPLSVDERRATVLAPTRDRAIKTEGTNMAIRRAVLAELGGFDPAFRFYLDETDLNLRLAKRGLRTAIAPLAQVHHSLGASAIRRRDRTPTNLYEIGASWAVFLRKHCGKRGSDAAWQNVRVEQRKRVLTRMVQGYLEPRDVRHLMRSLVQGYEQRRVAPTGPHSDLAQPAEDFRPYCVPMSHKHVVVSGRFWSRRKLRLRARELAATRPVTLIRLSPTALFHKVCFVTEGYWEQTGGLFGKSDRDQPFFRWQTFNRRVSREIERVRKVRGL